MDTFAQNVASLTLLRKPSLIVKNLAIGHYEAAVRH